MNIHKNARLTLARRIELIRMIVDQGFTKAEAAQEAGVSEPTARKWLGRYLAEGEAGLNDHSSRPKHSPRTIEVHKAVAIVELRRRRLTRAHCCESRGIRDHGRARAASRRTVALARSGALATGGALRAREPRGPRAHRYQEARAHRTHEPPRYRQPP
jgi:transposase